MRKHLFFRDEIKHHEEDRTAEKVLDLPARSPALRDEGRAEPLVDLTRTLKTPSKTCILANTKVTPNMSNDRISKTFEDRSVFLC